MEGIGTIINVLAVLVGAGFGMVFKGYLKTPYQQLITRTVGLLAMGVGLYELIRTYFVVVGKELEMEGILLVGFSIVCGLAFGIVLNVERLLNKWGVRIGNKLSKKDELEKKRRKQAQERVNQAIEKGVAPPKVKLLDRLPVYELPTTRSGSLYADGFVAATLLVCTNSMLLSGVYADCMTGNTDPLIVKAIIDLLLCLALSLVYGGSVMYAAIPLLAIEGAWTVVLKIVSASPSGKFAQTVTALLTPTFLGQMSLIGAILLIGTGICLATDKKFKIANLLPATVIPLAYDGIMMTVTKAIEK